MATIQLKGFDSPVGARELIREDLPVYAQALTLIGILEELKTTNHILASIYKELKPEPMSQPPPVESPQIRTESLQGQEQASRRIVYYVLGRDIQDDCEYKIIERFQGDDPILGYPDWYLIWRTFFTRKEAEQYIKNKKSE
jgi:hypothetical protein